MTDEKKLLSENISVFDNFQYAINIGYDLYSEDKIRNYIPTESAVDLMEDIILSTSPSSSDRARIFVGPYGKGKSHLALVILSMLCRNDSELYSNVLSMICHTKPELCDYIKAFHKANKKLLPVVVQGSGMGIRQSLLFALRKALENVDLSGFMPETYFKAAILAIKNWKNSYPETYKNFVNEINCSVEEFENELNSYNNKYYEEFVSIYPSLTSGSEFNPVNGMDVVALYSEVAAKIKEHGYEGIFVVYDEFSKYLEGNIKKIAGDEIKALQDFAECCNRSKNNQIHILLISHKNILNYIDNLSKTKVDAWKAVSNRFKSVELNTSPSQTYDLLSKVISHNENWFGKFKKKYSIEFDKIIRIWNDSKIFSDMNEGIDKLTYSCYPLSPITLFMLPRISEEIAQNERTLFTFMSSKTQKNTLSMYLSSHKDDMFNIVTPDYIFDYFEPLFKAEAYDKPIHKYWKAAKVALKKLDDNHLLEKQIIKTLTLIYIIGRFDLLPPETNVISNIYDYGNVRACAAISYLQSNNIIRVLDNKNHLRIVEHTDIDIDALISDETEKIKLKRDVTSILNEYVNGKVVYPNSYNDRNYVIRYFDLKFINASELDSIICQDVLLENISGDGAVYAVVNDAGNMNSVRKCISKFTNTRIAFIVSKSDDDVSSYVYKYYAIKSYIDVCEDTVVKDELSISLADLEEYMDDYIDSFMFPEYDKSEYFIGGIKRRVKRRSEWSFMLSKIYTDVFYNYPIINNEMINKNIISSQAQNSRNKVLSALLDNDISADLGLKGSGQEVSIMRTTLKNKGMIICDNNGCSIKLNELEDVKLQHVIDVIKVFVINASEPGGVSFSLLYDILQNPENGIGLKKGIIPIYIACVLHYYKKYAVITKNNKEIELSSRLLDSINEKPDDFNIYVESWNAEKEEYISSLATIFSGYIKTAELQYSNFDYIVRAMQRWYLQLPKYSKEVKKYYDKFGVIHNIDKATMKFVNLIKGAELNARETLFDKVIKIYGYEDFSKKIADDIKSSKLILDSAKINLINFIISNLRDKFDSRANENESFSSIVMNWYDSLNDMTKNHVFNDIDSGLLDLVSKITPNEVEFIEQFAKIATGLRIDDWADVTVEVFFNAIDSFIETINSYNEKHDENSSAHVGSYKLTFINENGDETYKTFDLTEYSGMANLMYSDIEAMLDEYGEAISKNEKRQILVDIINNLLS